MNLSPFTNDFFEEVHQFLKQFEVVSEIYEKDNVFWIEIENRNLRIVLQKTSSYSTDYKPLIFSDKKTIYLGEDIWKSHRWIVEHRLLYFLHQTKTIPARLTAIRRIDKETSDFFLEKHHLQGSPKAKFKYGLFLPKRYFRVLKTQEELHEEEILMAVATFSAAKIIFREKEAYRSFELIRFANHSEYAVVGGFNKLVQHFIKEHQPDDLMTYADADWSDGEGYEKRGFERIEKTVPQAFFVHRSDFRRIPAHRLTSPTEEWIKCWNSGSWKFLLKLK